MFNKKDYLKYFDELYRVEIMMKKEATELLKVVTQKDAKIIIEQIKADEIRHAKIVKDLIKLIK